MDFEHTEDRRMLADTLNRYLAEQAGIEVRHAARHRPQVSIAPPGKDWPNWARSAPCSRSRPGGWAAAASTWPWCLNAWGGPWRWNRCWAPWWWVRRYWPAAHSRHSWKD